MFTVSSSSLLPATLTVLLLVSAFVEVQSFSVPPLPVSSTLSSSPSLPSLSLVLPGFGQSFDSRLYSSNSNKDDDDHDDDDVDVDANIIVDLDAEKTKVDKEKEMDETDNVASNTTDDNHAITDHATETLSSSSSVDDNLRFLQTLGATTGRGEFATNVQKQAARQVVESLESSSSHIQHEHLQGTWELVYCSTQLFRSSPFFMAGRAVCETDDAAQQYNWFCDMHRKALAVSTIRAVRQVISDTRFISEFEVSSGSVPFLRDLTPFSYSGGLPFTIDGALVSSADYRTINNCRNNGTIVALELYMDTVEIKGSNVPGLRQLLDQDMIKLESRRLSNLLEQNVPNYTAPRPIFRITYLTQDGFRISRDQDDNIFVYCKTSDSITPTTYNSVDADLGFTRLLEGFNDAVTKIYL